MNVRDIVKEKLEEEGIDIDYILTDKTLNINSLPKTTKNFNKAAKIILQNFYKNKFIVLFDVDVDGIMAGYIAYDFLNLNGAKCDYFINRNRIHGTTPEFIEKALNYDIVICVDSCSNDLGLISLLEAGKQVIVIDHHELEKETLDKLCSYDNFTLISNKFSDTDENIKYLSGAMMTYYTFEYISSKMGQKMANKYFQLGALTLISDKCYLNNFNICILKRLYSTDYYQLTSIIKDFADKLGVYGINNEDFKITSSFIDYSLSPLFNSLIRFCRSDKAIELLLDYKNRPSNIEKYKILTEKQQRFIKLLINQASIITGKKYIGAIDRLYIADKHGESTELSNRNFSGVVASKIKDDSKMCSFYLIEYEDCYKGSFRGTKKLDYLSILEDGNYTLTGHQRAFGLDIPKDNLMIFLENIENRLPDLYDEDVIYIENLDSLTDGDLDFIALINEYRLDKFILKSKYHKGLYSEIIYEKYSKIRTHKFEFLRFNDKPLESEYLVFYPSKKVFYYDLICAI